MAKLIKMRYEFMKWLLCECWNLMGDQLNLVETELRDLQYASSSLNVYVLISLSVCKIK